MRVHVTYDIVTPESATRGDTAELGFVLPGGAHEILPAHVCGAPAGAIKAQCGMRLRDAIDLIGCVETDGGGSFYETDGRQDYRTGTEERRALHLPDNATAASLGRVARLLAGKRLL